VAFAWYHDHWKQFVEFLKRYNDTLFV
jgi:hypothetical protein